MDIDLLLEDFWMHVDYLTNRGSASRFTRIEQIAVEMFAAWLDKHFEVTEKEVD